MRRIRRRRIRRQRKMKAIVTISIFCIMFVMVAGYAAMQTNLEIKAKGNVVKKDITTEELKYLAVTDGDGLYADIYEEGRYIYKGANPNNYITFNNETWRIISVEIDGTIKIMRNKSIGNMAWDTFNDWGSKNWARPADLNTYLNEEYLLTISDLDKIVTHNFSIGAVEEENDDLAGQIAGENETTWNGKVGMITVSEHLRANTNTKQCGTLGLNNGYNDNCLTTNWIYSIVSAEENDIWTISPDTADDADWVFRVSNGYIGGTSPSVPASGVCPVVYLSSDITLSGTGTETDPFRITN